MVLFFAVFTTCITAAAQTENEAEKIIRRVDDLLRGKTQYAKITMTVVNPEWSAPYVYTIESWSEGLDKAFIRILSPAKDAGITFLKLGVEMWQYLPRIDRTMKIPPSMMLGSWMGSDFTNDDLVKEASIVEDYQSRLTGRENSPAAGEVAVIELAPRPAAAVVWGKIIYRVRLRDMMPLSADFYDEDGILVRRLSYEGVKTMGGRTTPTVMRVVPQTADKKGRETILTMSEIVWDQPIPAEVFSLRHLKSKR